MGHEPIIPVRHTNGTVHYRSSHNQVVGSRRGLALWCACGRWGSGVWVWVIVVRVWKRAGFIVSSTFRECQRSGGCQNTPPSSLPLLFTVIVAHCHSSSFT